MKREKMEARSGSLAVGRSELLTKDKGPRHAVGAAAANDQ
jgi:hypothetical protein